MIKTGNAVKVNCSIVGLIDRLGIDDEDAFKIKHRVGTVSQVVDKETLAVNFSCLNNGFDYRFEKKYLMKA